MKPNETRIYTKKIRPILQYSKDGVFIREFKNISEAVETYHIKDKDGNMIRKVANGDPKRKSAYGFI